MLYSFKKLSTLTTMVVIVCYVRFFGIQSPFATTPPSNAEPVASKATTASSTLISSEISPPKKLVFVFLPVTFKESVAIGDSESKTTGAESKTADVIENASSSLSETDDFEASTKKSRDKSFENRSTTEIVEDFTDPDINDTERLEYAFGVPTIDPPKPYLHGARPFQPYRQHCHDCGAVWWVWFLCELLGLISWIDSNQVDKKHPREKLSGLLPDLTVLAWISSHLVCLIFRPFWTLPALFIPLGGILLLWSDLERIGRKVDLLPIKNALWSTLGLLNGTLAWILILLLPQKLLGIFAILFVFNFSFDEMHHFICLRIGIVQASFNKNVSVSRGSKRRKQTKKQTTVRRLVKFLKP